MKSTRWWWFQSLFDLYPYYWRNDPIWLHMYLSIGLQPSPIVKYKSPPRRWWVSVESPGALLGVMDLWSVSVCWQVGVNGKLVDPGDPQALEGEIVSLFIIFYQEARREMFFLGGRCQIFDIDLWLISWFGCFSHVMIVHLTCFCW